MICICLFGVLIFTIFMSKNNDIFHSWIPKQNIEHGAKWHCGNRGEIVSTKNYDESGKVSLEMTYHPNGQVKERIEYISGKAELSRFDANGNKIK